MAVKSLLKLLAHRNNSQGKPIYNIKPSEMTQKEMQRVVKAVNDSLYRLEKSGVQGESKAYQSIEHYAVDLNSKYYNVSVEGGTIRATKDFSKFSTGELYEYINNMRKWLSDKTRTVAGTKRAMKKSFDSFKKMSNVYGNDINKDLTYDRYKELWKLYRNNVNDDIKGKAVSDDIVRVIFNTDFYMMDDSKIASALQYFNNYDVKTAREMIMDDIDEYITENTTLPFE